MCIVRTAIKRGDINTPRFREQWTALSENLRKNRNKGLGDLGSGNHFLDCVVSHNDESVCFVVHTGSRTESGLVDHLVEKPSEYIFFLNLLFGLKI
jgi:RNA-splicing ligase RtcB